MRTSVPDLDAMIALAFAGSALGACSYPAVQPDPRALATATKWLSMVDADDYAQAFPVLSALIRSDRGAVEQIGLVISAKRARPGRRLSCKFVQGEPKISRLVRGFFWS